MSQDEILLNSSEAAVFRDLLERRELKSGDATALMALLKRYEQRVGRETSDIITSRLPPAEQVLGVTFTPELNDLASRLPPAGQVLGVTFTSGPNDLLLPLQEFIIPTPPIVIATAWKSLASRIADGSRKLDELGWKQFEDLMAEILETSGWSITPMGYTKDGGVDIIAVRNLEPGVPIEMLVQCKRHKRAHRVGVNVIKQLWATKWDKCSHHAMVAATSSFTRGARTMANVWKMDLQDYDAIVEWCKRLCG
jgi:HJR/Mrr/RecB family endonuclease